MDGMSSEGNGRGRAPWRVTLVGPCAAGKSTLRARLQAAGVPTQTVAQEHSHVPYLWQGTRPDVLVYLDVGLTTLRQRRGRDWTQVMLDAQHARLAHARQHAHLYLPTDHIAPDALAAQIVRFLQTFDPVAGALPPLPAILQAFQSPRRDV